MGLAHGELGVVVAVTAEIDLLFEAFLPLAGGELPCDVYTLTLLQLGRRVQNLAAAASSPTEPMFGHSPQTAEVL